MDAIAAFNSVPGSFSVAMNQFGDLAIDEFQSIYFGYDGFFEGGELYNETSDDDGGSKDWRTAAVTGVKNQLSCGSDWAFSITGALEGCLAIKYKNLTSFSEQQLIDCSDSYGNYGCSGGDMGSAFNYIQDQYLCTESTYPYTGSDDGRCYFGCDRWATLTGTSDLTPGSEQNLLDFVQLQPISVAIDASQWSFMFYSSGVYYEPACNPTNLVHAALVVGYGSISGNKTWIVKNSWGTDWGDEGYIYMSRNQNNNCGIATQGLFVTC